MKMEKIAVLIPCYNEEENVRDFYDEFIKNESFFKEKDLDFELIYVDDGSRDHTVAEVKKLIYMFTTTILKTEQEKLL